MKRIICMLMSIIMVLSLSGSAAAVDFTDVDKDSTYTEAIDVLNTLGIIQGYDEKHFGPNDTLTRAQFCAMIVRTVCRPTEIYGDINNFNDVPGNYWARRYIDTAVRKGLMNGYSATEFGPENKITYTQVVKVILNILGYENLEWPTGVDMKALSLKLYNGLNKFNTGDAATRAHAAQMIYNAFDCELVDSYGVIRRNFLNDVLGLKVTEPTMSKDGRQLLTYIDLDGDKYVTDVEVSNSQQIILIDTLHYRMNEKHSKTQVIDKAVKFYINGTLVKNKDADFVQLCRDVNTTIGIFDNNDKLIAITIDIVNDTNGTVVAPIDSVAKGKMPKAITENANYDELESTVTYWTYKNQLIDYEISNSTAIGKIVTVSAIESDGLTWFEISNNGVTSYKVPTAKIFVGSLTKDNYAKIFFDVNNNISGVMAINVI